MRTIDTSNSPDQGTLAWHRTRLGKFTGSSISKLMGEGRKKGESFSQTAQSYIYQVMAERNIAQRVIEDDDLFDLYIEQTSPSSKAMQWGTDNEDDARDLYKATTGNKVTQCGSVEHESIHNYAASPDGIVEDKDKIIEIKCPTPYTAFTYQQTIHDNESLKAVKPEYYWQVQAEMDCTGATACDFIVYCPFLDNPMHIVTIQRCEGDIEHIHQRIALAEQWAQNNMKP